VSFKLQSVFIICEIPLSHISHLPTYLHAVLFCIKFPVCVIITPACIHPSIQKRTNNFFFFIFCFVISNYFYTFATRCAQWMTNQQLHTKVKLNSCQFIYSIPFFNPFLLHLSLQNVLKLIMNQDAILLLCMDDAYTYLWHIYINTQTLHTL